MASDYTTQAKGVFESADQDFSDSEFNGTSGMHSMPGAMNMTSSTNIPHGHRNGVMSSTPPVNNVAGTNSTPSMNDGAIGNNTSGYRNGVLSGANSQRNGTMNGPTRMGSMAGMNGSTGMNGTSNINATTGMGAAGINGSPGMNGAIGMNGTSGMNGANMYRDGTMGGPASMSGAGNYRGGAMKRSYSRVDPDFEKLKALRKKRSTATITITPELLEKMDASPQDAIKGDLRKSLGNPTPMYA